MPVESSCDKGPVEPGGFKRHRWVNSDNHIGVAHDVHEINALLEVSPKLALVKSHARMVFKLLEFLPIEFLVLPATAGIRADYQINIVAKSFFIGPLQNLVYDFRLVRAISRV